ncbi:MAG TPA: c-type cytochrome [Gammaproteobacteria bacterium]|nr:c-type cytochrome [Gammaproteobacteria bacterium]
MKNGVVWVAGVMLLVLGATSASAAATKNEPVADKKDVAALYLKNCSICHGDKGDGNTRAQSGMYPKPRNFTTAEAAIELTRERMIKSVTEGRPGTTMVAHKKRLSEQQIADLVDYIRSNFMQLPEAEAGVPAAVSPGEKIYTANCAVCHGDNGNTARWAQNGLHPAPRDFTSPEAQNDLTRDRMLNSVTNGRPGTGMMPYKTRLSKDEIAAVVGFIRFKFMGVDPDKDTGAAPLAIGGPEVQNPPTPQTGGIPGVDAPLAAARPVPAKTDPHQQPHATSTPAVAPAQPAVGHSIDVDMSLPVPNGLKGDLVWGRQFYMANCFDCHGVTGEGDGPRAYFNIPRPRNFTSEASRQVLNRPRIFNSVTNGRVGTVMPAWGKVLTEQEIAGLTEFVFQTFIQPAEEEGGGTDKKKVP